jgi:redox-sensitive bicupin YhaK (pirin superfamily)
LSFHDCPDPVPGNPSSVSAIQHVIVPRARDLGGFEVRRALPAKERQMIGPFIFWDQMGPALFDVGKGVNVRPHPHIGLATVTYLFDGQIFHRDSLGSAQPINPGDVNWMRAGRGIVHSERTDDQWKSETRRMFGIQSWVALPRESEESEPAFVHIGQADLPLIEGEGKRVRVIAGSLFGEQSPLQTASATLYADLALEPNSTVVIPADYEDRAIYIADGSVEIEGNRFDQGQMVVFLPGTSIDVKAVGAVRLMLLGGEPMEGHRHIWWNFVSSSRERIEQAKEEWRQGKFDIVPGDAEEFIPLPGT